MSCPYKTVAIVPISITNANGTPCNGFMKVGVPAISYNSPLQVLIGTARISRKPNKDMTAPSHCRTQLSLISYLR